VAVVGAGSIGCFVGGWLGAAGARVHFIGRPRVLGALQQQGLTLTDLDGLRLHLPPGQLSLHASPQPAALVLLCVKSGATAEAAASLNAVMQPGTLALSLQNGVANVETAKAAAPALLWLPGMVPFNVAELAPGSYHRGTQGDLAVQDHPALAPWLPLFEAAGLPLQRHADLRPVQWAKLLLNLNNPVNALSGLPLKAQLLNRHYRIVTAALQQELLHTLRLAGITPAQITALPPHRLPQVLRLPTWLFKRVAARLLRIDDHARSSMADDVALGRTTEIDALCGAVVRLAASQGTQAPLNEHITRLMQTDPRPRSGPALRAELGL
jgi:2-dehydropantoate 2-reductase